MSDEKIFKFQLGDKLKDRITGYEGLVTARHQYLNGCKRYTLDRPLDKDGKVQEAQWFDEAILSFIDEGIKIEKKNVGGPQTGKPPKEKL